MVSPEVLARELSRSIEGEVRFDRGTLVVYSTDASNYRQIPLGVVAPRHDGDMATTLRIARENGVPILARGGGTSLAGQTTNAALVLDFSRYMNRMIAIDAEQRIATVEPGVVQCHLNPRPHVRAVLRARPVDQGPMHDRRHDRQQFVRGALGRLRQDGRQSRSDRGASLRRIAHQLQRRDER